MGKLPVLAYSPGILGWLRLQLCIALGCGWCGWGWGGYSPLKLCPPPLLNPYLLGSLSHTCHHPHSLSLQPSQTLSPPPWGHFSNKHLPPSSYSLCPSSLWFPLLGSLFHAAKLESHSPDCGWPFFPSAVPLPRPTPWLSPAFPQTFFHSPLSNWPRPVPLNVLPGSWPPLVHISLTERLQWWKLPCRLTPGQPDASYEQAEHWRRGPHRGARGLGSLSAGQSPSASPAKVGSPLHTGWRPPCLSLSCPRVPLTPPPRHLAPPLASWVAGPPNLLP